MSIVISFRTGIIGLMGLGMLAMTGCSVFEYETAPPTRPASPEWVIYDAKTGAPVNWNTMTSDLFAADIILLGEQHNNVIGHELEQRLAQDLFVQFPDAAIAMEMFERHEQAFVDLYLDGELKAETLIDVTNSANWGGGKNTWSDWYQPIVDAAKAHRNSGAAIIAANAPREYARLARLEDYATLQRATDANMPTLALQPDDAVDDQSYRDRFVGMMSGHGHGHGHGESAPQIDAEAYLRAQRVWDATMANAVLAAKEAHAKVLLIVGDFHIANQGGTQQRIRHHGKQSDVATVSVIAKENVLEWNANDANRADFVIYTAKP